jgi:hypothetical protein
MVKINNNYIDKLEKMIYKKTDIKNIKYVNEYGGYYIVMDNDNIYLFNYKYDEITRLKVNLVYKNDNNYDIVYRDKTIMYMDNYENKNGIIFKYYDIHTYEEVDSVVIGG